MKKIEEVILAVGMFAFLIAGCSKGTSKDWKGLPGAFGRINQVVVVADSVLWHGAVGDTFDFYFAAPYLLLPQPEPIYDLKYFSPHDLAADPIRKQLRTYIILADMGDENSPTVKLIKKDIGLEKIRKMKEGSGFSVSVGKSKWASGQTLVYMLGFGEDKLIENIQKSFPSVAKRIFEDQRKRIVATVFQGGVGVSLKNEIQEKLGISLKVPADYKKAVYDEESKTMWIRKDNKKVNCNILIHKMKYSDKSQLTKEGLKAIQDSLGRKFISTDIARTYMRINDVDLPMFFSQKTINNYYALEARGIWDIVNDFMGGPFISYLILNPKTNELLFIDGFVHAPGQPKRDFMQQLEVILSSVKF